MCPTPKKEVDLRITYQGITLGFSHFECHKHVQDVDSKIHMRDIELYNIWSLPKKSPDGRKMQYSEPCIGSFVGDEGGEATAV